MAKRQYNTRSRITSIRKRSYFDVSLNKIFIWSSCNYLCHAPHIAAERKIQRYPNCFSQNSFFFTKHHGKGLGIKPLYFLQGDFFHLWGGTQIFISRFQIILMGYYQPYLTYLVMMRCGAKIRNIHLSSPTSGYSTCYASIEDNLTLRDLVFSLSFF